MHTNMELPINLWLFAGMVDPIKSFFLPKDSNIFFWWRYTDYSCLHMEIFQVNLLILLKKKFLKSNVMLSTYWDYRYK